MSNRYTDSMAEENRIRSVYQKRDQTGKPEFYAWHRADNLWNEHRIKMEMARSLKKEGLIDLSGLNILDVGCGTGGWLRTLSEWGADPDRLQGIDLLENRIEKARLLSPNMDFQQASGFDLPFADESMDVIMVLVVFSSILDDQARSALAVEMRRVLRKEGTILVFDFKISNPRNPDTVAIGSTEIKRLFPGMKLSRRSLILAPPLSRRISPISLLMTHFLEACCPFLRTHSLFTLSNSK
jgi:SAM-dependent methyltransferase